MITLIGKLKVHPTRKYRTRAEASITTLVIHHSGERPPSDWNWERQIKAFANYHVNAHGWPGIGYHYVIAPDGNSYKCNGYTTISYHAKGGNATGIGICLLGNFEQQADIPAPQWTEAKRLCAELRKAIPSIAHTIGHRQVQGSATACPGRFMLPRLHELT